MKVPTCRYTSSIMKINIKMKGLVLQAIAQADLSLRLAQMSEGTFSHVVFSIHYENTPIQIYRKISPPKTENFQIKNSENFHILAQNIDCGYSLEPPRRGGSNEYPQSMFLSRNKKNNVYPRKPQFYYIKVGLRGVKII